MFECVVNGEDSPVILSRKDIPMVVVEEFKQFGSLQNHEEVQFVMIPQFFLRPSGSILGFHFVFFRLSVFTKFSGKSMPWFVGPR